MRNCRYYRWLVLASPGSGALCQYKTPVICRYLGAVMYKAVLFDLDGTLLNSIAGILECFGNVLGEFVPRHARTRSPKGITLVRSVHDD